MVELKVSVFAGGRLHLPGERIELPQEKELVAKGYAVKIPKVKNAPAKNAPVEETSAEDAPASEEKPKTEKAG